MTTQERVNIHAIKALRLTSANLSKMTREATFIAATLNNARNGTVDIVDIAKAAIKMRELNRLVTETAAAVRSVLVVDEDKQKQNHNTKQITEDERF